MFEWWRVSSFALHLLSTLFLEACFLDMSRSLTDCAVDDTTNFLCGICLEVLRAPRLCRNGHAFCKGCLTAALARKAQCPECRAALSPSTTSRSLHLEQAIASLQIRCDRGCGAVFALPDADVHEAQCAQRPVRCLCDAVMPLNDLPEHWSKDECRARQQLYALGAQNQRLQDEGQAASGIPSWLCQGQAGHSAAVRIVTEALVSGVGLGLLLEAASLGQGLQSGVGICVVLWLEYMGTHFFRRTLRPELRSALWYGAGIWFGSWLGNCFGRYIWLVLGIMYLERWKFR